MAFEVTETALSASQDVNLKPNIVLKIEDIDTIFGAVEIKEMIRYGKNDIAFGDEGLVFGGSIAIEDQSSYISFQGGTSSEIRQTLQIDKGIGESTSNITVALIDKNEEISKLISPGLDIPEILGRRVKLYFGFADRTNFPEDYITIFRGVIQSVESKSGLVSMHLSHPDQKKRSTIFTAGTAQLDGDITSGATVATVDSTVNFLEKIVGPDSVSVDEDFRTYIKINDEIIEYQTLGGTGTQFQTLTRGAFGTTAAAHSDTSSIESLYRIGGNSTSSNGIKLALKLMLSGETDYQFEDIPVTSFVRIDTSTTVANSIFFNQVDVSSEYNLQVGDFVEITGATSTSNNISPSVSIEVNGIVAVEDGSYITLSGASLVEENDTSAVMKIKSQFAVWPDGLRMKSDEVDIDEHLNIFNTFLPNFPYDFYLHDEINGKDFLSEEIYNPMSAFNLPRKSQSSMGIHVPPLPGKGVQHLNLDNIINPSSVKINRSTTKNIANTIVYKFDEDVLEEGKFINNTLSVNQTATDQLDVGRKAIVIESKGMREVDSATVLAAAAASRRLKKYAFGAEYLNGVKLKFADGYKIEIADKVLLDFSALKLTDIKTGTRSGKSRIMEVVNKRLGFKNGSVTLDLVDTNFDNDSRFGLVAPSSKIKSATGDTKWVIKESFYSRFGINEFKKWESFIGAQVRIVSPDYVTRDGNATLKNITGNTIEVETSVGFTPLADDLMLYSKYDSQANEEVKLIYVHLSDGELDFTDGGKYYGLF